MRGNFDVSAGVIIIIILIRISIYTGSSTHSKVVFTEVLHPIEFELEMLTFEEKRKPENLKKSLAKQS